MRIALAVWKGRISPVFDVSRQILILTVKNGSVAEKYEEIIANDDPLHRVSKLAELRIQTLICGAVSQPLANMLAAYGIRTIPFTAGEVEAVISAYLADALPNPSMSMPGCRGRRRQRSISIQKGQERMTGSGSEREPQGKEDDMPKGNKRGSQGRGSGKGRGTGQCGGQGKQGCGRGQGGQKRGGGAGQGQKNGTGQGPDNGTGETQ